MGQSAGKRPVPAEIRAITRDDNNYAPVLTAARHATPVLLSAVSLFSPFPRRGSANFGLVKNHSTSRVVATTRVESCIAKRSSRVDRENRACRRSGLWLFTSCWNIAKNMPEPVRTIITRSRKRLRVTRPSTSRSIHFGSLSFFRLEPRTRPELFCALSTCRSVDFTWFVVTEKWFNSSQLK